MAVLTYAPFAYTTFISFTKYNGLGTPLWVGLKNYVSMFKDPHIVASTLNTGMWVLGTLLVPVALGLVLALLTYDLRGGMWLRLPFLIPYAVSGVTVAVVWAFILQPGGALNEALALFHLPGSGARWLAGAPLSTAMMVLAYAWQATGVNMLLFVVGLQAIPPEPLEAARLDGASGLRLFGHILWPMLRPLTTVVVGLAIVGSLKTFDIVWVMTKGGPGRSSETLAITMYRETFMSGDYGGGAAVALALTVVTLAASVLYIRRQLAPNHHL
jgi:multiple sugar transport system permease protein